MCFPGRCQLVVTLRVLSEEFLELLGDGSSCPLMSLWTALCLFVCLLASFYPLSKIKSKDFISFYLNFCRQRTSGRVHTGSLCLMTHHILIASNIYATLITRLQHLNLRNVLTESRTLWASGYSERWEGKMCLMKLLTRYKGPPSPQRLPKCSFRLLTAVCSGDLWELELGWPFSTPGLLILPFSHPGPL